MQAAIKFTRFLKIL